MFLKRSSRLAIKIGLMVIVPLLGFALKVFRRCGFGFAAGVGSYF
jgi:hypothetical protein